MQMKQETIFFKVQCDTDKRKSAELTQQIHKEFKWYI